MPSKAIFFLHFILLLCACQAQPSQPAKPDKDTVYQYKKATPDGIGKYYFGREIAHVMGAAGSEWLERDERNQEENTKLAIEKIDIPQNGTIADIGAGTGYYSFRLAQKVPQGKVLAVEIQDEMIGYLKAKKQQLNDTVEIVKGSETSPNLPDNSVDLAMMVDVYHELAYPQQMLQAIHKSLKPHGKLLLLEYRGEDPDVPIKKLHKTTVAQLAKELSANDFRLFYKGDFLPMQHFWCTKRWIEVIRLAVVTPCLVCCCNRGCRQKNGCSPAPLRHAIIQRLALFVLRGPLRFQRRFLFCLRDSVPRQRTPQN